MCCSNKDVLTSQWLNTMQVYCLGSQSPVGSKNSSPCGTWESGLNFVAHYADMWPPWWLLEQKRAGWLCRPQASITATKSHSLSSASCPDYLKWNLGNICPGTQVSRCPERDNGGDITCIVSVSSNHLPPYSCGPSGAGAFSGILWDSTVGSKWIST